MSDKKEHWENIYENKKITEVSWYQPKPEKSLNFIAEFNLDRDAGIIDIGGGDGYLVDFLLAEGYTNVTVLDISKAALKRPQERLGENSVKVKWIVADIAKFTPSEEYQVWHDRAAFHFLNEDSDINNYLNTLEKAISPGGYAVIGTFSKEGPAKCSGINIRQYSSEDLKSIMPVTFRNLYCENIDHTTPSGAIQNFTFCSFKKTP